LLDEGVDEYDDDYDIDEFEDLTWLVDREIKVMKELDHPHIVHLEEVFEDTETACFVMELAKGGEVFDRLIEKESFDEIAASNLVVQVLSGIVFEQ
jgi:serine/threonine protein kinase